MTEVVIIGVLTFRRPDELSRLLVLLDAQACLVGEDVTIVVVDNDPDCSGRRAVDALAATNVVYVSEPEPGIAAGRNRALRAARDADLLIFIDDDETPSEHWLGSLLHAHRQYPGACIVGPVVSAFDGPVDPWIRDGGFFARKRHPTGASVQAAGTGNILFPMDSLRTLGVLFDGRFGLTGGSDTLFTRTLVEEGIPIIWCDEASILDHVPSSRLSRRWVLQRALRSGNSWSRASLVLASGGVDRWRTRLRLTGRGALRMVGGSARALYGTLTHSVVHQARGTRTAVRGMGFISGAYGYVYTEYKRPAGTSAG